MCGRYVSSSPTAVLATLFDVERVQVAEDVPRYNVAPTDAVKVVVQRDQRVLEERRWGLVPHWAKAPGEGAKRINARAETVMEQPAFRDAFASRRCIVPADGFYEWKRTADGRKQPYYVRPAGGGVFAFAGLRATWGTGDPLRTCAIITTDANATVARLHDRMPAVLPQEAWGGWLDPATDDLLWLRSLLVPVGDDAIEAYPVSSAVGNVRNDEPSLIERIEATDQDSLFG